MNEKGLNEFEGQEDYTAMELEDISNADVLYYLEEVIECGLADEIEQNVYYDIKLMNKYKKWEMKHVKKNMMKMYDEKF